MPAVGNKPIWIEPRRLWEKKLAHWLRESPLLRILSAALHDQPFLYGGPATRLSIHPTVWLNDAYLNVASGTITFEEWAFVGSGVSILTGTHDVSKRDAERQASVPYEGRDVRVRRGAWIGSNATILGPCVIGEHAVVGAGSLVRGDVAPYTFVAGVPAEFKAQIP